MKHLTLLILLAVPSLTAAEPQPAVAELMHYASDVPACLDGSGGSPSVEQCIGQGAAKCMDTEADGYSTIGMMFCTMAEAEVWDIELNRAYADAIRTLGEMDAVEAVNFPEFAVRVEKLREAQRAWITLRDADCGLEYAMWGAGSIRNLASSGCRLDYTAKRTIYLENLGVSY